MSCCLCIIIIVLVLVVLNEIGKYVNEDGDIILTPNQLIEKLQSSFPGSNITKGYKNCCDQYRINW